MRIAVIQTAFLGDVVLTTSFLRAIQEKWPDAVIDFVTTPEGCQVLDGFERLNTRRLDKKNGGFFSGLAEVRNSIKNIEFDVLFSVHRSPRSLLLGRTLNAKRRVAFSSLLASALGYQTVAYPEYSENTHYADKPTRLLSVFGEAPSRIMPRLRTLPEDTLWLKKAIQGHYIVLSPFSVWGTKMWPADRFAALGVALWNRYKQRIVLSGSGGAPYQQLADELTQQMRNHGVEVENWVGQTHVGQLKALIEFASLVVSNDSAAVHLAAAYDVPAIAIFGPTAKKWGFFPLSTKSAVVENRNLGCRPCHIHGPSTCPLKHFRCMNEIEVEDVVKAVETLEIWRPQKAH